MSATEKDCHLLLCSTFHNEDALVNESAVQLGMNK